MRQDAILNRSQYVAMVLGSSALGEKLTDKQLELVISLWQKDRDNYHQFYTLVKESRLYAYSKSSDIAIRDEIQHSIVSRALNYYEQQGRIPNIQKQRDTALEV